MSDRTLPHHRILSSEAEKQAAERLDGLLENWFLDGYGENDYLSPLGRSIFIESFLLGLREGGVRREAQHPGALW
jgi:hypothetical protein